MERHKGGMSLDKQRVISNNSIGICFGIPPKRTKSMKAKTLCLMLSLLTAASVCVSAPTSVRIYDIQRVRFDRAADNFLPLASGKCGSNLNRRLYDDGRLTGTGAKITVSAADCIAIRMHILTHTSLGTTGIWLS